MPETTEALVCNDAREWNAWLTQHYSEPGGVGLLIAQKRAKQPVITLTQPLDEASPSLAHFLR